MKKRPKVIRKWPIGGLVARWFLGGEMVGGEIPWWRDDRIPFDHA